MGPKALPLLENVNIGPGVASGPGVVNEGGLTSEQVRRAVMAHTGALRACYETEAQRLPQLRGGVTVAFTIEANGSVSQATVSASTLQNTRVEGCLLRQIKSWRFPESDPATTVTGYPFRFGVGG
jgi:outer membrane biosynthesis protein TonB